MKKIIETIKNIWRIEDLRVRILITILFVAIYRFGSFIVLPGIDPSQVQSGIRFYCFYIKLICQIIYFHPFIA